MSLSWNMTERFYDTRGFMYMPIKVFLSGKMTGEPEHGYPVFNAYEKILKGKGYDVINPTSVGVHDEWTWADYMKKDLSLLLQADMIALLPGFYSSRGSRQELYLASTLEMKTIPIEQLISHEM